jgi:hypothetical protein
MQLDFDKLEKVALEQVDKWGLVLLTFDKQSRGVEVYCVPQGTQEVGTWAIRLNVDASEYYDGFNFMAQPMMNFDGWNWAQFLGCEDRHRVGALQKWSTSWCERNKQVISHKPDDRFIEAIEYTYGMMVVNRARQAEAKAKMQEMRLALHADSEGKFYAPNAQGFIKMTFNDQLVVNLVISTPNVEKIQKVLEILREE